MKKLIITLFIVLMPFNVYATDSAKSSIVMDIDSGRILYENNINEKRLIASITKIMTAIVAIENGNLSKYVKVNSDILKMYGTSIYLEVNEKIKLIDLLYGLMLRSGNDAAIVIANAVASNESSFVKLMNEKAKSLGMSNTIFNNSHGLDDTSYNYSTAKDMAILTRYAYNNKTYRKIAGCKKYQVKTNKKSYIWYNRVKQLNNYKYCTGAKNGYTPLAGKTLVTTNRKNDFNIVIVSLNDSNYYENHKSLANNVFNKYKNYTIVSKDKFNLSIADNSYYIKESFKYPLTDKEKDNIKVLSSIDDSINYGKVGNIKITLYNKTLKTIPLYIREKKKENIFTKMFS